MKRIKILLPQFERTDGIKIIEENIPKTKKEFENLKTLSHKELIEKGLILWEEGHYLFPGEWYDYIPDGIGITSIFGTEEYFNKNTSDSDIRSGALAYGFKK